MTASVLSFEARKITYRTADGEERPTFTGIPDWLSAYKPQLAKGRGWELLDTILHHQRMGQRNQPVAISLAQFAQETGHAIPTVRKALSDLARVGLLYEELDEPERRDSGFRYAIQDLPGQGMIEQEGRLMVSLLDGWHEVDPSRVVHRALGVQEICIPQDEPGVQEIDTLVCKKSSYQSARNFHTGLNVSYRPPAAQYAPEAAPAASPDNVDTRKKRKRADPPHGGAAGAAPASELLLKEREAEQPDAPSSEHESSGEARSSAVGAAPAPSAPMNKPSLFPAQTHAPAPALRSAARIGKQAKRGYGASELGAAKDKTEEQTAQEARKAALIAVWLAHQATVQPEQMSETERRRFYSGIAKLAQSSLTLEELPDLIAGQARWSRGTYTPDPHTMEASLGTLRREVATWKKKGTAPQKGDNYDERHGTHRGPANGAHPAGLAGTGGANHEGDAAILAAVQRVRARQSQEATAGAETCSDPAGR